MFNRGLTCSVAVLWGVMLACAWAAPAPAGEADGAQLWSCSYWQTVCRGDFSGAAEALKPIELSGPRGGAASGWVVLTCRDALRGVKATAGALAGEGGKGSIEAKHVLVRFAAPGAPEASWVGPGRFDALLPAAPAEVPVVDIKESREFKPRQSGPQAVQPIWVTVLIPRDAAGGKYGGKLSVEAGGRSWSVELKLAVSDWTLPETRDYKVRNMGVVSPDRVAEYYKVPAWSEKHLEVLGRIHEMMPEIGNRQVVLNLVAAYPAMSNTEAVVKWVKEGEGKYGYDFAAFDKYLDAVDKKMGKPFPIRLNMWAAKSEKDPSYRRVIQVVDKAGGQASEMAQPDYASPDFWPLWKPALTEVKARLDKRGWFDAAAVNWFEYCGGPPKGVVSGLKAVWPGGQWSSWDHGRRYPAHQGEKKEEAMPILVNSSVWNEGHLTPYLNWDGKSPGPRGFQRGVAGKWAINKPTLIDEPRIGMCGAGRDQYNDRSTLMFARMLNEEMIMRGQHGIDSFGVNYWPLKDAKGRFTPGSINAWAQGPSHAFWTVVAPGPDGPLATERYEALREGVQIAEAMIFLQRALDDKKADGALAEKINKVLDGRAARLVAVWKALDAAKKEKKRITADEAHQSELSKDGRERDAELYAVCGEVAKATGGK